MDGGGGGGRRRSGSPAPIDNLLQQLRALGMQGGRGTKTYAGLAAGRNGGTLGPGGSGGYSSGGKERGAASAFFRRQPSGGDAAGKVRRAVVADRCPSFKLCFCAVMPRAATAEPSLT